MDKKDRDRALKEATRELIGEGRKLKGSAFRTRVGKSSLSRYQALSDANIFMPVDIVADLENAAQKPVVTHILAKLSGWEIFPLPPVDATGKVSMQLKQVFKESGELLVTGAAALEDNRVDASEAREVLKEADDAIAALVKLRHLLLQRIATEADEAAA